MLGYSYGVIFLLAAAGLLLSMNAMNDFDLDIARRIGNLSVLSSYLCWFPSTFGDCVL